MIPPSYFLLLTSFLAWTAPVLAGPDLVIDTAFSADAPSQPVLGSPNQDLPFAVPSVVTVDPNSSSRITVGTEALDKLKPPFAMFDIGGKNDDPSAVGNALLRWDLAKEGLTEGDYEITATVTPLSTPIQGGRLLVTFGDETGKPLKFEPSLHPGQQPVQAFFSGGEIRMGGETRPFNPGETYVITMKFSIDRREWRGSVNGEEIVARPFPPQMASQDQAPVLLINNVFFGSAGAIGDKPDARYALSRLQMKKVPK